MARHKVKNPDRPKEIPAVLPKDWYAGTDAGKRFADKVNKEFQTYLNHKSEDFIVAFIDAFNDNVRHNTNGLVLLPVGSDDQ